MQLLSIRVYVLLIAIAIGVSTSQVLIKYAAVGFRGGDGLFDARFLGPLLAGFTVSVIVQLVWMWTLQTVPLSQGYMAMALTFVFVPLLGWHLFNESLSLRFATGVVLIVTGVLLTVKS